MLADLRIESLAVVKRASASFSPGLNVISGETGAGKTILLHALSLALGARAHSGMVRSDEEAAIVEARFELRNGVRKRVNERLAQMGLPSAGDELVVRRQITAQGKSRAYINDAVATARAVQNVTHGLVDLTGQHDQYGLLKPERQLDLLDAFADVGELRTELALVVNRVRGAKERWEELRAALANRAERGEFLRFYLTEFEKTAPQLGEDQQLSEEARRLNDSERLRTQIARSLQLLYECDGSAFDRVCEAKGGLESLVHAEPRAAEIVEELESIQSALDDVSRRLSGLAGAEIGDPARLEEVESRLLEIHRLTRKHGLSLDDLIEKMSAAAQELEQLDQLDSRIEDAELVLNEARGEALHIAQQMSDRRAEAIEGLVKSTMSHLVELGFSQAKFEIEHIKADGDDDLGPRGLDKITFVLSTNPGESAKPLSKVASGGELSRMLLALKCAFAQADPVPVHVLDEIDSGIGGGTAEIVGRKIRQLADSTQVLCVTHLPQIASFADAHLVVVKEVFGDGTRTRLERLADGDRTSEVARMLGGTEITKTTEAHAREMLRGLE